MAPESDRKWSFRSNLFGFDGCGVLAAEAEIGDGHVVEDDVEIASSISQLVLNTIIENLVLTS